MSPRGRTNNGRPSKAVVRKLCQHLGYPNEKGSKRSYLEVKNKTAPFRESWEGGQNSYFDVDGSKLPFPSNPSHVMVQQCVTAFLGSDNKKLWEETEEAKSAEYPTLPTDEIAIRAALARLMCQQARSQRRNRIAKLMSKFSHADSAMHITTELNDRTVAGIGFHHELRARPQMTYRETSQDSAISNAFEEEDQSIEAQSTIFIPEMGIRRPLASTAPESHKRQTGSQMDDEFRPTSIRIVDSSCILRTESSEAELNLSRESIGELRSSVVHSSVPQPNSHEAQSPWDWDWQTVQPEGAELRNLGPALQEEQGPLNEVEMLGQPQDFNLAPSNPIPCPDATKANESIPVSDLEEVTATLSSMEQPQNSSMVPIVIDLVTRSPTPTTALEASQTSSAMKKGHHPTDRRQSNGAQRHNYMPCRKVEDSDHGTDNFVDYSEPIVASSGHISSSRAKECKEMSITRKKMRLQFRVENSAADLVDDPKFTLAHICSNDFNYFVSHVARMSEVPRTRILKINLTMNWMGGDDNVLMVNPIDGQAEWIEAMLRIDTNYNFQKKKGRLRRLEVWIWCDVAPGEVDDEEEGYF